MVANKKRLKFFGAEAKEAKGSQAKQLKKLHHWQGFTIFCVDIHHF